MAIKNNKENKIKEILDEKFSSREDLINHLEENTKVFKDSKIKKAFEKIDRADFVGDDYRCEAYEDYPIPIGYEQTISQPTTLAFMLELLDLKAEDKVLDIGSGSGWSTALLAEIVGEKGSVLGQEIVPELVEFGKKNIQKYKFRNAKINKTEKTLNKSKDLPGKETEYDKILVSATFKKEIPVKILNNLKNGGIIVAPVDGSICKLTKNENGVTNQVCHEGFVFVPYIYEK